LRYGDRVEDRPVLGTGRAVEVDDIASAVRLTRDVTAALAALLVLTGLRRGARR
jgi:adenosylcobinamide-phosphate synthase